MIEPFYLFIISTLLIIIGNFFEKKNISLILYVLQTFMMLLYLHLYSFEITSKYLFIILSLGLLESLISFKRVTKENFNLNILVNLSLYAVLCEKFPLISSLAIIATDFTANMTLKYNRGNWLKSMYSSLFRSSMLLLFLVLIILSTGSLDLNIEILNMNIAYLGVLFAQICIYSYLMLFNSNREFKVRLEEQTKRNGVLTSLLLYGAPLFFIIRYLTILFEKLDPQFLTVVLGINVAIFLFLAVRSVYQFLIYTGKDINPYRFIRLLLFSFYLIYLTNQASQVALLKYLMVVLVGFAMYVSALNYNVIMKNEFTLFSLASILILPLNPLYNYYEKGFNSSLIEIIIAFSIILISGIMIYSTLSKLSFEYEKKINNRNSKLVFIYALTIIGLNFI